MIQRTLTALFSLAVLILPASQLYADSDAMSGVYSGLECKYEGSRWDPASKMLVKTYAGMDNVVYHSRLGIGNNAAASMGPSDAEYNLTVSCPLPSLAYGDVIIVGAIDGTVFDDVTCRIQSCVVGLGDGSGGEGACNDSAPASTHADGAGFETPSPITQGYNYITQNISWVRLEAPDMSSINRGARNERAESGEDGLGRVYSHLLCTLPEQDDVSPAAPGLDSQMRDEMGISYIQSYYMDMEMMDDMDDDDHGHDH